MQASEALKTSFSFILMEMGNYQRVIIFFLKVSLASLVVGKKINLENNQMAIAVIQARDEGGLDQGGSSHGEKRPHRGSTLQVGITRLADGLDGGVERKHWVHGDAVPKIKKTGMARLVWFSG